MAREAKYYTSDLRYRLRECQKGLEKRFAQLDAAYALGDAYAATRLTGEIQRIEKTEARLLAKLRKAGGGEKPRVAI